MTRTHKKTYYCSYIRYKFLSGNVYKVRYQETAIRKRIFELQEANAKTPCFSYETLPQTPMQFQEAPHRLPAHLLKKVCFHWLQHVL
jgi:hypothetical protein